MSYDLKEKIKLIKIELDIRENETSEIHLAKIMGAIEMFFQELKQRDDYRIVLRVALEDSYYSPVRFLITLLKGDILDNVFCFWEFNKKIDEQSENTINKIFPYIKDLSDYKLSFLES